MEVEKILVVDDEPSILKLLKEVLTQWGYHVACVGTGAEALEAIRTERFDAAITDIRMPEMSGLDLLRVMGYVTYRLGALSGAVQ